MTDTLVVAISQSGTTTDTNRTVDLARARGATVLAIVNRRNSDLVDRTDGVLYTSDGRDVEMSVASTKAFYAQVAAGFLLAFALADELTRRPRPRTGSRCSTRCATCRTRWSRCSPGGRRSASTAQRLAPGRRYWAVVGNGANRIAAHEVRIKLSELCYKSIACDGTEDKKHIDLSAEPLILVCGAGLSGSNADDVAKELAIYRAHKAAAVAIVDEGDDRFGAALETIEVPAGAPGARVRALARWSATSSATRPRSRSTRRPARCARPGPRSRPWSPRRARRAGRGSTASASSSRARRRASSTSCAAASTTARSRPATAVRLASLFRYATRVAAARRVPGRVRQGRHAGHRRRGPHRRADARRSRSSPARSTRSSTRPRRSPSASPARTRRCCRCRWCSRCSPPARRATASATACCARSWTSTPRVAEVTGLHPLPDRGRPGDARTRRSAWSTRAAARRSCGRAPRTTRRCGAPSRSRRPSARCAVTRGRSDGRTVVIVPEVKGVQTVGLTLLHLDLKDRVPADVAHARALRVPQPLRRAARCVHRDRARASTTSGWPRPTSSTCSPSRSTSSPTAGAPTG